MRQIYIVIALLAVLSLSLFANTAPAEEDLKIVMMPAVDHQVRALVSLDRQSILFMNSFEIPKAAVQSGEVRSFFLHKDMVIESITINGLDVPLFKVINLQANNFEPRLRLQALVDVTKMSSVYSFTFPKLDAYPENLEVKINYYLPFEAFRTYEPENSELITLRGENYWYPRSNDAGGKVNFHVSTPQNFDVLVNDIVMGSEERNRRKAHQLSFQDKSKAPASITFIHKKLN